MSFPSSPLTADGTTDLSVTPGVTATLIVSGTWGNGSLAIGDYDADSAQVVAFTGSPLTANGRITCVPVTGTMRFVLSGATGPSLYIKLAGTP